MADTRNSLAGDLKKGGDGNVGEALAAAGIVGSYLRPYAPMCILWSVVMWVSVKFFMRFDLWFAVLFFLTHTVPLVLLLHFPDILEFLDRPVARETTLPSAAQEEEDEDEYVIVHAYDAKASITHHRS